MVLCVAAKEATTMPDYMRALHQRFVKAPPGIEALEDAIEQTEKQLKEHFDTTQRKLLLRLTDQESELRSEASLYAFIAGYRLACGIHRELLEKPPYSFEQEEEERAKQSLTKEGGD